LKQKKPVTATHRFPPKKNREKEEAAEAGFVEKIKTK